MPALIGAGGVLLGVVVSWLLGQASAYFAAERERRARLRVVLGELLELGPDLDEAIVDVDSNIGSILTVFERGRTIRRVLKRNPLSDEDARKFLERLVARLVQLLGGGAGTP